MKKTIYVNGIVVGEVEATGDVEADIQIIREFLESKGLHREVTMAQAMFRQALSFCQTAAHLHDRDLVTVPRNGLSVVPFVVNSALSIELYLKTLHHVRGASPRGHSLLELYDALSDEDRDLVVGIAQQHGPSYRAPVASAAAFRSFVAALDTAFVDWRYCYETGEVGTIHIEPTVVVMKALDEACRRRGAA